MKIINQILIIFSISFLGEIISAFLNFPVPGNVIGMLILLALLISGVLKIEMIEDISSFLLNYLPFFFIPAGVNLISSIDILAQSWQGILAVFVISTILVITVTALTVDFLSREKMKKGDEK